MVNMPYTGIFTRAVQEPGSNKGRVPLSKKKGVVHPWHRICYVIQLKNECFQKNVVIDNTTGKSDNS
jgi:hypothetical protein